MANALDTHALEQAFFSARTFNKFRSEEVSDELLNSLYDLMKWGPTSMNCQPGHYVVVKSEQAKKRLQPVLAKGNQEKTMAAPATIIVATDSKFYKHMPSQFPANPNAQETFEKDSELAQQTAFRNATLQGGYLIIAARMLGLDCGPMSGFNNKALDAEFFPGGRYQSNFLINIGFGDASGNYPRGPRLQACQALEII